jgi:hypothetical protein
MYDTAATSDQCAQRVWYIPECTDARVAVFQCGASVLDFTQWVSSLLLRLSLTSDRIAVVRMYMQLFELFLRGALEDDLVTTASDTPGEQKLESRQRLVFAKSLRG